MSTINNGDKFLVNRNNTSYQLEAKNTMAQLQDNDLMLVNRGGTSYKITGADVKEGLDPTRSPVVTSVSLVQDQDISGARFDNQGFTSTVGLTEGVPSGAATSIKATVQAQILDTLETSPITSVSFSASPWATGNEASNITAGNWHAIAYGNGVWIATATNNTSSCYSTDGINWQGANGSLNRGDWQSLAFGQNKFVAVGHNPDQAVKYAYSTDGITWSAGNAPTNSSLASYYSQGVAYGDGVFVSAGISNNGWRVVRSTDGINWTGIESGSDAQMTDIAYGNGLFIACSKTDNASKISRDGGLTWENMPVQGKYDKIAYGNGKFVMVKSANSQYVATSVDGYSWQYHTPPDIYEARDLTYGGGLFVMTSSANPDLWTSFDGIVWSMQVIPDQGWIRSAYGDGMWNICAYGGDNPFINSNSAGTEQFTLNFTNNKDLDLFSSGDTVYQDGSQPATANVALSDSDNNSMLVYNSTGTWFPGNTARGGVRSIVTDEIINSNNTRSGSYIDCVAVSGSDVNRNYFDVVYGDNKFVAISVDGIFSYSSDGVTWTDTPVPTSRNWNRINYGGGKFVAICGNGDGVARSIYSFDGISWNNGNIQTESRQWYDLAYGNSMWVAVARDTNSMYSSDGINWTTISNPGSFSGSPTWTTVAYGDGKFVAAATSASGAAPVFGMYSTDGINWTKTDLARGYWESIHYADGMFVLVSSSGPTWAYSYDGINYEYSTGPVNDTWAVKTVTYGGGKWLVTSTDKNNRVGFSYDGINWQLSSASSINYVNHGVYGAAYGDNKWVIACNSGAGSELQYSLTGGNDELDLTFSSNLGLEELKIGDNVRENNGSVYSTVAGKDVAANKLTVGVTAWSVNTGTFLVGPPGDDSELSSTLYAKLDLDLNVLDLQSNDPGFVPFSGTTPTIQFPGIFPDGQAPDSTLLEGTSIFTTVKADNLVPTSSTKNSNTITPASSCTPGPIETTPITGVSVINGPWNRYTYTVNGNTAAYGNGVWVILSTASSQRSHYSTNNGLSFQPTPNNSPMDSGSWQAVAFSPVLNRFAAVSNADSYAYATSDDGINWVGRGGSPSKNYQDIAWGKNKFVAVVRQSEIAYYSYDGINWSECNTSAIRNGTIGNPFLRGIAYSDEKEMWVAVGESGLIYSVDGITWYQSYDQVTNANHTSVVYGNGKFVAIAGGSASGTRVTISDDGISWTSVIDHAYNNQSWRDITYGRGSFAVVSHNATYPVYVSYDGIEWFLQEVPTVGNCIEYGNGTFLMVNGTYVIYSDTARGNELSFSFGSNIGITDLNEGDAVTQEDGNANGVVSSIDVSNNSFDVAPINGVWEIGQKVIGPNRVCPAILGSVDDAADVSQFNAAKASLDTYETERDTRRASLKSAMLSANFTANDIAAAGLDDA